METNFNEQKIKTVELASMFEVEELEERIEFGKWSAKADGTYVECSGGDCDGKFKGEVKYTMTAPW